MPRGTGRRTWQGAVAVTMAAFVLGTGAFSLPRRAAQGIGVTASIAVYDAARTVAAARGRHAVTSAADRGAAPTLERQPQPLPQSTPLATDPPYWFSLAGMHSPRVCPALAAGQDGLIYALGGGPATVEAYALATNSWRVVAQLPFTPTTGFAATTGPDGHIYVIGGSTRALSTNALAYLPGQRRWLAVGPALSGHQFAAATTGPDGRIYIIGGSDGTRGSAAVEAYDPATRRWQRVANLPAPRGYLAATTGLDGRIYAIGGSAEHRYPLPAVDAYDVRTRRWTRLADLPFALQDLGAAAGPDGRIYAIGGVAGNGQPLSAVEAYDPRVDQWAVVATLRTPRHCLAAVRGAEGGLYAIGGDAENLGIGERYGPILHPLPACGPADRTVLLMGGNFAAPATVRIYWGSPTGGMLLATTSTGAGGSLFQTLSCALLAKARPVQTVVTAVDDHSLYPVTTTVTLAHRPP